MIAPVQIPNVSKFSSDEWEPLVVALREELQEYGALLNLLTQQQNLIIGRNAQGVFEFNDLIDQQIRITHELRAIREQLSARLVESLGIEEPTPLRDILHYFPEKAQHLLQALIDEIYSIVEKTQHRARQNQMLIKRATEVTEKILQILQPKPSIKTYTRKGNVKNEVYGDFSCLKASA